jgi:hypothetical protein
MSAVTFTAGAYGHPVAIVGQDQLWCSANPWLNPVGSPRPPTNYESSGFGTASLTWQPSLSCPSGTFPVESVQTAFAEDSVTLRGAPGEPPEVYYLDTANVKFDTYDYWIIFQ